MWYPVGMDENRPPYRLQAPGAVSVPSYELPAYRDAPRPGLHPSDTVRRRILSTTDLATLDRWLLKAVAAASPEEVVKD